jgi:hypothetical protein
VVEACQESNIASLGSILAIFLRHARLLIPVFLYIKARFYVVETSVLIRCCVSFTSISRHLPWEGATEALLQSAWAVACCR